MAKRCCSDATTTLNGGSSEPHAWRVRLDPADEAGVLVGVPTVPLPEGDYVVALKKSTGGVLSVSGVCIRETKERWPRRFQAMLEEQARFAVAKPASERPRREGEPLFSITTAVHDVISCSSSHWLTRSWPALRSFRMGPARQWVASAGDAASQPRLAPAILAFASGASRTTCTSSGAIVSSRMCAGHLYRACRSRRRALSGRVEDRQLRGRAPRAGPPVFGRQKIALNGVAVGDSGGGRNGRTSRRCRRVQRRM